MRITVAAVGRFRRGGLRDLYADYAARLSWPVTLQEVVARKAAAGAALRGEEGRLLAAALPGRALLICLDRSGRALSSEDFAARLGDWRDAGVQDVAFAIGGAEGLAPALLERAELRLSLGPMTWPHMLVRVLLMEQLYRAQTILAGHPYHR